MFIAFIDSLSLSHSLDTASATSPTTFTLKASLLERYFTSYGTGVQKKLGENCPAYAMFLYEPYYKDNSHSIFDGLSHSET